MQIVTHLNINCLYVIENNTFRHFRHNVCQSYRSVISNTIENARLIFNKRDLYYIISPCPVWHSGLTAAQSTDIEREQKRCLRIVYPELSYRDALFVSGLEELATR
jgi:hypothetical protein